MGRGDKKTRKGKIRKGSYGVSRPRLRKATVVKTPKAVVEPVEKPAKPAKKAAPKKAARKKTTKE